jgi:hypothetical protein
MKRLLLAAAFACIASAAAAQREPVTSYFGPLSVAPGYSSPAVPHPAHSRCSAYDIACNTPERKHMLDEYGIKKGRNR